LIGVTSPFFFAKIAQKLNIPGLNANRLGILLRVQQGMAFHVWSGTFIVSSKILLSFGVKIVSTHMILFHSSFSVK